MHVLSLAPSPQRQEDDRVLELERIRTDPRQVPGSERQERLAEIRRGGRTAGFGHPPRTLIASRPMYWSWCARYRKRGWLFPLCLQTALSRRNGSRSRLAEHVRRNVPNAANAAQSLAYRTIPPFARSRSPVRFNNRD